MGITDPEDGLEIPTRFLVADGVDTEHLGLQGWVDSGEREDDHRVFVRAEVN